MSNDNKWIDDEFMQAHGVNMPEVSIKREKEKFLKFFICYTYKTKIARLMALEERRKPGMLN
jgi:hypothetical protein